MGLAKLQHDKTTTTVQPGGTTKTNQTRGTMFLFDVRLYKLFGEQDGL